jgi:hypothetical protein
MAQAHDSAMPKEKKRESTTRHDAEDKVLDGAKLE